MRESKFRTFLSIIILDILIICIAGCGNKQDFSGSKASNDTQFLVDFDILNCTVSSKMFLLEGEKIETHISIKKGKVDILVENENGKISYRGNNVRDYSFIIKIEETGTYTFYVKGSKAEGSVYFIKYLPASENAD